MTKVSRLEGCSREEKSERIERKSENGPRKRGKGKEILVRV